MTNCKGLILLTGPPGVGKTTLVKEICENLSNEHHIVCNGFYTEEVRDSNTNKRIGFDIITLNGKQGMLSRECRNGKGPFVGKYCVYVKDFEDIALPLMRSITGSEVLVLDEVGKMELKSKEFEISVENCLMKTFLLATIPSDSRQSLRLVNELKNHREAQIIAVTKKNRNHLQNEVAEIILKLMKL